MHPIIEAAPGEMGTILGAGIAAMVIGNSLDVLKGVGGGIGKCLSGPAYHKQDFMDTIFVVVKLFKVFKAEGAGGMPEFLDHLGDEIVWGAFKVVGVDDRGNTVSRRPKYIFVKYTPPSTSAMKRATAGRHKGSIKPIFTTHVDFEIESKDELTEDEVVQKLRASGGAHQPTSYEFSNFSS